MNISLSIFSYRNKYLGLACIALSVPFLYLYFWGGKPAFFNVKIFAIVTTYLETRYFMWSQTNLLDELAALFFLSGMTLISFSKEKTEKPHYEALRRKALTLAVYITILFWLLSFLLIYGMAIFMVSFSVFIVFLLCYNLLFRIYLFKDKRIIQ